MKKVKDRLAKSILIGLLAIIAIFGISRAITSEAANSSKSSTKGTIASGEKNPKNYSYNIRTTWFETTTYQPGGTASGVKYHGLLPTYGNYSFYCIQPSGGFIYSGMSYNTALGLSGKSYSASCGHASTPREGEHTMPVFIPSGSPKELPPAVAYITSGNPQGEWSIDKQRGIWNLRNYRVAGYGRADGNIVTNTEASTENGGPSKYDGEAVDYLEYDLKVRKDEGLNPEDKTDINSIYAKINQQTGEYTVGPFSVKYTEGIHGNVAFSGISNMTVIGYNKNGEEIKDKNGKTKEFKIEKIYLKKDKENNKYSSAKTPQYFTPSKDLKIDTTEQVYPKSEQDFQVVFKDPNKGLAENSPNRVASISIKVHFKYMLANGKYQKFNGYQYYIRYRHSHSSHSHTYTYTVPDGEGGTIEKTASYSCYNCTTSCYLSAHNSQDIISADAIRTVYEHEIIIGKTPGNTPPPGFDITMDLGGHVWEDVPATKETKTDGVSNTSGNVDKALPNVKVTLYVYENGKETVANLLSNNNEANLSAEELLHRVNPTYTDSNGNYMFKGLNPMKKYIVKFTYNGQTYLPTEYLNTSSRQYNSVSQMVNAGLYNTNEWNVTSKGTESTTDRNNYDNKFGEIGSYPNNYRTSNSLGMVGSYNATFTHKDLMGYTLDRNGKYTQSGMQLVDGYLYDANGFETTTYAQGVITTRVKEFIRNNKKFPNATELKRIYQQIAGNNREMWQKLQFIEDCNIEAYTGSPLNGGKVDTYPVYNQFKINHEKNGNYDDYTPTLGGVKYPPIYTGQFYVNLGLWRRQEFDTALRKDVYGAALKINDKTSIYKYDKRTDDESYWDINVRMSDYDAYYSSGYNRELYKTDYDYKANGEHPGANLEVYVTYKITIRNQSQSIMSQIKEVVDYYDKNYTYKDNLSWVIYKDAGSRQSDVLDDDTYYDLMANKQNSMNSVNAQSYIKTKASGSRVAMNAKPTQATTSGSKYGSVTHSDVTNSYNAVYVRGLQNKKLATGESAYIYLTFQVNKDSSGRIIVDNNNTSKSNLAELNGYSTYYKDNTQLPNRVSKNSNDIAGLLDIDSNPGNLVAADIRDNDRYEKNFEDDTDRAKNLRIIVDNNAIRKANGNVWEDQRTETAGDSKVGNGIMDKNETRIAGVKVELVEKMTNGKEYVWDTKTTNEKGEYNFANYIPGDYVIRFYYGDSTDTVKVKAEGGKNDVSYNGQDFKSTTYQAGMEQSQITNAYSRNKKYPGYLNASTKNESGTYGYDIYAADAYGKNISDVKDIWSRRQTVNGYSDNNVTNHKAEVLASPYITPSYNGKNYTAEDRNERINELITNTHMIAETGVIAVEFEYDRQQTQGTTESNGSNKYLNGNDINGHYTLNNIDFGITERPKAQLEINKSIDNVKVTLANSSVLFDVKGTANNVIWKKHDEYELLKHIKSGKYEEYYGKNGKDRYSYRDEIKKLVARNDNGLIQLTIDEELMHGATIQITYKLKVTNVGEVDYEGQNFYYLGNANGATKVTTTANQVVDYVANNLQFNSNNTENSGWNIIKADDLTENNNLVNGNLQEQVKQFNNIIQTEGLNKKLIPGESTEKTLILTQLITNENTSDDLTYNNIVEVVKTSNTVGRRMAYSIVGNQNPTNAPEEVDSSMAERVIILPPFGNSAIIYAALGIGITAILAGGIIFIRRKVLKNK